MTSRLEVNVMKATNRTHLKMAPGNLTTGSKNQTGNQQSCPERCPRCPGCSVQVGFDKHAEHTQPLRPSLMAVL